MSDRESDDIARPRLLLSIESRVVSSVPEENVSFGLSAAEKCRLGRDAIRTPAMPSLRAVIIMPPSRLISATPKRVCGSTTLLERSRRLTSTLMHYLLANWQHHSCAQLLWASLIPPEAPGP